jgi:hypothetical protein
MSATHVSPVPTANRARENGIAAIANAHFEATAQRRNRQGQDDEQNADQARIERGSRGHRYRHHQFMLRARQLASSIQAIWIASRIFSPQCFGSSSKSGSAITHSRKSVEAHEVRVGIRARLRKSDRNLAGINPFHRKCLFVTPATYPLWRSL